MRFSILFVWLVLSRSLYAQYAPQAGLPGSQALHYTNPVFTAWADSFIIKRGWLSVLDTSLGVVSVGDVNSAKSPDQSVVSLGDGGEAIVYVENPIVNRAGADFAIFENGFYNLTDSNLAFLELAFVEVSEDGQNYYRFESVSLMDTTTQVGGFDNIMDARKIHNLAGKYIARHGTPFDLQDLASYPINLNNIHYIKIIDVVGSLQDSMCTYDYSGRKVNDPFPTPFPSGGFDLDAVGIIHQLYPFSNEDLTLHHELSIFPNPSSYSVNVQGLIPGEEYSYEIKDFTGRSLGASSITHSSFIDVHNLPNGHYFLLIGSRRDRKVLKFQKL